MIQNSSLKSVMDTREHLINNGASSKILICRGRKQKKKLTLLFIISILTFSANGQVETIKPIKHIIRNESDVSITIAIVGKKNILDTVMKNMTNALLTRNIYLKL